ncbi:GntR family transcriptional regulator [Paenibacillus tarimensis]|uniref:GntR family transcriptional regulator n=1 Tax=Paenibacillus tarimensis TaxID=416012 RepID=UPI001F21F9AC|nr:GntR family transcriptional regulator [Paenibacillus tarimensis]MCF2945323.1 GntR family transcriptional regulator [Paenibacillus tarimensis]
MTHSFQHSQPIYTQIMDIFYQRICRGELGPGDKLPSVRDAAVEVGVNPNTIQRSYMEMERQGVVETRRGQGTFVTTDIELLERLRQELARNQISLFLESMKQLGYSPHDIMSMIGISMQAKEDTKS